MNNVRNARIITEEAHFLTDLIGARAYFRSKKIGKLSDVVVVDQGKLAEVTHFQIARPFGEPSLLIPYSQVRSLSPREIIVDYEDPRNHIRGLLPEEVLLKEYLLDKKVLDIEEREVEVVYDLRLVTREDKIYVSDVDISRYGMLRQLGLKGLADYLYKKADDHKKKLIPWTYIQPLPPHLGALRGNVKLNVLKEKLVEIHPVDLADILEELDSSQRVTILEGLDTEHASDTLEEIDPPVQRDIVLSLRKERVVQLIGEMTPGQAADILSVLPAADKKAILKLLEPAEVSKIEEIIEKQDINILNFATSSFFKFSPDTTVEQAQSKFRESVRHMDVTMYLYIVGEQDKLLGVIDIKEMFMAEDNDLLKDLMIENVISLNPTDTMKQATDMFMRYGFRALPVTDENEVILGVVPYRDVMNLKHRILE